MDLSTIRKRRITSYREACVSEEVVPSLAQVSGQLIGKLLSIRY
ncbi:hypothetical protein [Aporhodopirellula aestuarii]|nr:hypothetical protein [Aporhodopirellula aestuarii]